jgi:signal transduction histidine kinase
MTDRVSKTHQEKSRRKTSLTSGAWNLSVSSPGGMLPGNIHPVLMPPVAFPADRQLQARVDVLENQLAELREYTRRLTSELILAEQAERLRIAAVLHDDLQPVFVAARMSIARAGKGIPPEQTADLTSASRMIDGALEITRTLTAELSPLVLQQEEDIVETIRWLAERAEANHGLHVDIDAPMPRSLPLDMRSLTYHIARELLLNVAKHAGTDRARITLRNHTSHLVVLVEDDGAGYDKAEVRERPDAANGGSGLRSVGERLRLIGGSLETETCPGKGTRVTVRVPYRTSLSSCTMNHTDCEIA